MFDAPSPTPALTADRAIATLGMAAVVAAGGAWVLAAWLRQCRSAPGGPAHAVWRLRFPEGARFEAVQAAAWFAASAPALRDGAGWPWVEVRCEGGQLAFLVGGGADAEAHLRAQFAAWFPEARLEPFVPEPPDPRPDAGCCAVPLGLERPDLFPLRGAGAREPDPLLGLLALAQPPAVTWGLRLWWGPMPADWRTWAPAAAAAQRAGDPLPLRGLLMRVQRWWRLIVPPPGDAQRNGRSSAGAAELRGAAAKARETVFSARLVAWAAGAEEAAGPQARAIAVQAAAQTRNPEGNALRQADAPRSYASPEEACAAAPTVTLGPAELASLFHVPAGRHPLVPAEASRIVPPTAEALAATARRPDRWVPLGEALLPEGPVPFGLTEEARQRHLYVVGKTGTGKSTLLAGMLRADFEAGRGLALLDPHGDLAEAALRLVPPERYADTVYLDPADPLWTVPLNPLATVPQADRGRTASGVLAAFRHLFADSWGPRLEHILRHALLLLLEQPAPALAQLPLLLTDAEYRERLLRHCGDPVVAGFFRGEFAGYEGRFRSEALAPVLNKVGQFLASPPVRAAAGGAGPGLPLRELMDRGGILIANLSAGRLGEDGSALLGGLLVAGLQGAALSRADAPESARPDFALVADEFQRFANDAFSAILSESRKYRLSLVLAHQYLDQVPPEIVAAVLGNAGSLAVFRTGAPDGLRLARELGPAFAAEDLVSLPAFRFCARVHRGGMGLPAFSARTVPVPVPPRDVGPLLAASRARWGRPRAAIETEIADLWERREG